MREIKFRAWSREQECLYHPHGYHVFMDGSLIMFNYADVLMQFTGLRDRNGKEIFEGDILKCILTKKIARVGYDHGMFNMYSDLNDYSYFCTTAAFKHDACEVIGDIYSSPDLLNAQSQPTSS